MEAGCSESQQLHAVVSDSPELCTVILRFRQPVRELGFIAQRGPRLLTSITTLLLLGIVTSSVFLGIAIGMGKLQRSSYPNDEAWECSKVELILDILGIALLMVFLALSRTSCFRAKERVAVVEKAFSLILFLFMTIVVFADPSFICRVRGLDPEEVFDDYYGSDSTFLMKIDCVLTAAHVGSPMRWCVLFPLQVLAFTLYGVNVFIVGSPEPKVKCTYNVAFLATLILVTSISKRYAEVVERHIFLDMLRERKNRCEAEFRLSQKDDDFQTTLTDHRNRRSSKAESRDGVGRRISADDASVAATGVSGVSGTVFEPMFEKDADPIMQLNRIAEMGDREHWRISDEELTILNDQIIGSGSFGLVMKAIFSGMVVAVKCPWGELECSNLKRLPELSNELRILRQLRHPNIITIHGAIVTPHLKKIALVLEYVQGVTLDHFMGRGVGPRPELPPPFQRYQVMTGVSLALLFLHTREPNIVHGDLKSANIMVEVRGGYVHPKLLDFGMSRIVTRGSRPLGGTLVWIAPEVLRHRGMVKCSADIYSFGRLLGFLATGLRPLLGMQARQIRWALKQAIPPLPMWPRGCVFKDSLKPLVNSCLRMNQSRRPAIGHVHDRLLLLPDELGFEDTQGTFLENINTIKQQRRLSLESTQRPAQSIALGLQLEQVKFSQKDDVFPDSNSPVSQTDGREPGIEEEDVSLLLHPNKLRTDPKAMAISLIELITSWNFQVDGPPCCVLHAGVRVCQQLCCQMLDRGCFRQDLGIGGQCLNCGMLGLDADTEDCPVCRSQPMPPEETSRGKSEDTSQPKAREATLPPTTKEVIPPPPVLAERKEVQVEHATRLTCSL